MFNMVAFTNSHLVERSKALKSLPQARLNPRQSPSRKRPPLRPPFSSTTHSLVPRKYKLAAHLVLVRMMEATSPAMLAVIAMRLHKRRSQDLVSSPSISLMAT